MIKIELDGYYVRKVLKPITAHSVFFRSRNVRWMLCFKSMLSIYIAIVQ